jgi:parallel beta-helix repeat protein
MKKTTLTVNILFLFLGTLAILPPVTAAENITTHTLYVGGAGAGNYSRIQAAVDNATSGDTIYVYPAIYQEVLRISIPVHLIGADRQNTVINGQNNDFVVTLEAGNTTLSGFTITQSKMKFPFAGVYVTSNNNIISDNILTDNFYGMQLGYAAHHNLISNNTIQHNHRCGVYFNHASFNTLQGNIVDDHPVNGFGLFEFSNNNVLTNNTFSDNRNTGVNIRESYDTIVRNNTFVQGQIAFHKPPPEYHTVADNNQFSDNVVSTEEERDAFVLTVVIFEFFVLLVYLVFRNISK